MTDHFAIKLYLVGAGCRKDTAVGRSAGYRIVGCHTVPFVVGQGNFAEEVDSIAVGYNLWFVGPFRK